MQINFPSRPSQPSNTVTPRLVRLPMVMRMTGLGRSTIYRMVAARNFPSPVRLGARAVAWRQSDIDACAWRPSQTSAPGTRSRGKITHMLPSFHAGDDTC